MVGWPDPSEAIWYGFDHSTKTHSTQNAVRLASAGTAGFSYRRVSRHCPDCGFAPIRQGEYLDSSVGSLAVTVGFVSRPRCLAATGFRLAGRTYSVNFELELL